MALMGINFPLAFNGQELIFRRVFLALNLTETEVDNYFTGPAFLAWNRMGNVQTWSGPLTTHWHEQQTILQKQILGRMREFGIIPVLPAFGGHVPTNFTRVYPNAKVSVFNSWGGFPG
jgi:alpha-N-acetylglucosaminidase